MLHLSVMQAASRPQDTEDHGERDRDRTVAGEMVNEAAAQAVKAPAVQGEGSVTVIIPVYNGERFIRRSLDSVLSQTYPANQILVIDDGSKDATARIVAEEYAGRGVTLIRQPNGGLSNARNTGLRAAEGEFIALLDADDWWEPEKLAVQVRALGEHRKADGNYTGQRMVSDEGTLLFDARPADPATLWPKLRWCNPSIAPSAMMLRRSAVESLESGFDERQRACEDWNMWFRLIAKGPFCACEQPLTDYRLSSGGMSGDARHMFQEFMKMLDGTLLTDLTGLRRMVWRRRIIAYQAFKACLTARAAGDRTTEREFMRRSVMAWPSPLWAPERLRSFAVTLLRS